MNLDDYNEFHYGSKNSYQRRSISHSWILCHTSNHNEGVVVLWDEEKNLLACVSQSWPHEGWQEYVEMDGSIKPYGEHWPWGAPDMNWKFIGEL